MRTTVELEGLTLDVIDEGRQPATIRLGAHTYYERRDGWRCATHSIDVTGADLVALLDRALATARKMAAEPAESTTSSITSWIRNEHAGAQHDEPYPSGDGEPVVPAGTECQLCDAPATVAVPFTEEDAECVTYICDEHARRLDADEPMHVEEVGSR